MALPFYSEYAATFTNYTDSNLVFEDVRLQLSLVWQHCNDGKTGLLRHGYDWSRQAVWADPVSGASPEVWGRVRLFSIYLRPCC